MIAFFASSLSLITSVLCASGPQLKPKRIFLQYHQERGSVGIGAPRSVEKTAIYPTTDGHCMNAVSSGHYSFPNILRKRKRGEVFERLWPSRGQAAWLPRGPVVFVLFLETSHILSPERIHKVCTEERKFENSGKRVNKSFFAFRSSIRLVHSGIGSEMGPSFATTRPGRRGEYFFYCKGCCVQQQLPIF